MATVNHVAGTSRNMLTGLAYAYIYNLLTQFIRDSYRPSFRISVNNMKALQQTVAF